jgi:HK97 family phage major capsid protein
VESGIWQPTPWNVGADEKTILGSYYLRGDATTGSYLVPVDYAREILDIPKQASVMLGQVTNYPVGARTTYLPVQATKPSVTWVTDETTAKTEGVLTFGQKTLSIKTAAVWVSVTDELLEDSVADLPAYIREQFQQAWGAEIDKQVLVASTAPFVGMTKDTSVNAVTMTGNTDFAAVTFQHLLDMENAISIASGEGALQGSVFIMHRKVFNYLRAKTDDMGNPIYQKPADGVPATIYNHPYILSDQMPYVNATATGFILLGNPRYWVMGARTAVMGDFRVYGDTIYNMQQDQVFFRLRIRAGFVGALPAGFAVLKTG